MSYEDVKKVWMNRRLVEFADAQIHALFHVLHCVSAWNRMAPNTFPAMAKATGNYLNSALIKMEAITNGYTEGIALDNAGRISEGSGENIFLVYGGRILTPPLAGTILPGITRDS